MDAGAPHPDEGVLRLRDDGVAARAFKDDMVVLDLRTSTYLSTNAAGTVLWHVLERGATRAQLIAALLDEFEVDGARAAADVDAFIADCRGRDLLA
jgi:hypothetical protein